MLTVGSLCTGYGGIEKGLRLAGWPVELAWVADNDPGAATLLAHRYPDVPNLGDITAADWSTVAPVDIVTAGFPCQDVSCVARADRWGQYAPAIGRWERVIGRPAPDPTEPGKNGQPRLSARFVEWMQGLPDGWVTSVPGLTRNQMLRLLGNGVVPRQVAATVAHLARLVDEMDERTGAA